MRKTLVVAVREYLASVRTKTFLITVLAMPVLMGGSVAVQVFLKDKVDIKKKHFAVVDLSGAMIEAVERAAEKRNRTVIFEEKDGERKQILPEFVIERATVDGDDLPEAKLALSDRVRSNELHGFVVIRADVFEQPGKGSPPGLEYYSSSATYHEFRRWLAVVVNTEVLKVRLSAESIDVATVERASTPTKVGILGLLTKSADGDIIEATETNRMASVLVPMALMMLMFMIVVICAQPLMHTVIEEKMQRIAEVLLGSIPPFQLMMGKLLGVVGVSLTIATIYMVGGFFAIHRAGLGAYFPTEAVVWFMVYLVLAVFLYGSMFIAVGAAVSDMKEAQNLLMPVMLLIISPMFVWVNVLKEPTTTFSTVVSLIPTATPMLMPLRMSLQPTLPLWQPVLGIVLVLAMACLFVVAAGRVFRVGILMHGQSAKLGQILTWVFRG